MKKNLTRNNAERERPRRLTLSRETIQILNDPSLLELAQGGNGTGASYDPVSGTGTENTGC